MGLIDTILSQLGSNVDVANLATKVGLPQDQVEQAIAALSQAHTEPGDTVEGAAQTTGLPTDTLQQIVGHIGEGGEGGAGGLLSGLAGKLFGR